MSSAVRTIHTPIDSLKRSSTPMPKSAGSPTLNCCGGSFSTFGNMKRPVAESAATDAAVKAPHATPSQTRRVTSGDVSSGSRALTLAAVAAAVVVLPDKSTAGIVGAGGRGGGVCAGGTGLPAGAPAGAEAGAFGGTGSPDAAGTTGLSAPGAGGFGSSAINGSQCLGCRFSHFEVLVGLAQRFHGLR